MPKINVGPIAHAACEYLEDPFAVSMCQAVAGSLTGYAPGQAPAPGGGNGGAPGVPPAPGTNGAAGGGVMPGAPTDPGAGFGAPGAGLFPIATPTPMNGNGNGNGNGGVGAPYAGGIGDPYGPGSFAACPPARDRVRSSRRKIVIPGGVPMSDQQAVAYISAQLGARGYAPIGSGIQGRRVNVQVIAETPGGAQLIGTMCVIDPRKVARRKNLTPARIKTTAWVMRRLKKQQKLQRKLGAIGKSLLPTKCPCKQVVTKSCKKR